MLSDFKIKPLSLYDILSRNLLLLTVMFIVFGVGIAVHFLDKQLLDLGAIRIQANRLSFLFFIAFFSCYVSLLYILIERYWVNFFTQIFSALGLFFLLLIIFNPVFRMDVEWFKGSSVEIETRTWQEVMVHPIGKALPTDFSQHKDSGCSDGRRYYFINFIVTVDCYTVESEKIKQKYFSLKNKRVETKKSPKETVI